MEKRNENRLGLDLLEYASATLVFGFLFMGARFMYTSANQPAVLGATSDAPGFPVWLAVILAGLLIMGVIVLFTVVLSHSTIRRMKRG